MKKYYIITLSFCFTLACFLPAQTNAAFLSVDTVDDLTSISGPVVVTVNLDPEKDSVSAVSGTFSVPADLFEVGSISTSNGVVSMWVESPRVIKENYFDLRTRIRFEGIIPGGFTGVRSPYYDGSRPGLVVKITLIPKAQGVGYFLLDDVQVRAHDIQGTLLSNKTTDIPFTNAQVQKASTEKSPRPREVKSSTLQLLLNQSELIENGAWHLVIREEETLQGIDYIQVAETRDYRTPEYSSSLWRKTSSPYVLRNQDRDMFIHVKVVYTNNTFALSTIEPVENSERKSSLPLILVGIILVIILSSRYAAHFRKFFKRLSQKNS